jgi:3',5'-cyclic AMP phosphodiesterase CpdA
MPVRLLNMSDTHFGGEDAPAVAVAAVFARAAAFDLLVLTGDLTSLATTMSSPPWEGR